MIDNMVKRETLRDSSNQTENLLFKTVQLDMS